MSSYSYVFNAHPSYIDSIYKKYKEDAASVDEGWRLFFEGFEFGQAGNNSTVQGEVSGLSDKEMSVRAIISGFRIRGHLLSKTNPIKRRIDRKPHLDLEDYDLADEDLDKHFLAGEEIGMRNAKLSDILAKLYTIYGGHIGFEYYHIREREKLLWLRDRIENRELSDDFGLPLEKKKRILHKLNGAVVFERFLHTKYIGQKRFSLEGGETTIAALDAIINKGAQYDVKEFVIGMAHRGRLNVLANIMQKTYQQIFSEFEGIAVPDQSFGDGDVKYHLGFSSQVRTMNDQLVDLKLVPNPSHLESVDPVVVGFARGKADNLYNSDYDSILPILIHGDAAIAGQGVVYETVQMSKLPGYYTGGTLHFVINNQIGFTTNWDQARSSTYCTAAANLVDAPVFHVNGDDPEAVIFAVELATEYRQRFNSDVFIDMVCYRRHGHNEGDDPKFTQPKMYDIIHKHPNPRKIYSQELIERGHVEADLAMNMEKEFWNDLQSHLDLVKEKPLPYTYQPPEEEWRNLRRSSSNDDYRSSPQTGIKKDLINSIMDQLTTMPQSIKPVSKVRRLIKSKKKLIEQGKLDWSLAELLAYASLMHEGTDVRMSGQDVIRGTFSHRHSIFYDVDTDKEYNRLDELEESKGKFRVYNSLLSEFAVLGFEYGYSMVSPNSLVVWEAQFGDFYNGAQTIVDQYITAAESKWSRMSGLVMLLPHGYEGQGPEHSSGRVERFLQAAAEFNITVANCTTPANFFHILRRQLKRPFRKPLIIMSPKSLLRHPDCISEISDFYTRTRFREVYDDVTADPEKVRRVIYCSGKIYFDLIERKKAEKREDVAIIRLEQLYPFPTEQVEALMARYKGAEAYWVQEEPSNMGAWSFIWSYYHNTKIHLIARKSSASPATGFKKVHEQQQEDILRRAFQL